MMDCDFCDDQNVKVIMDGLISYNTDEYDSNIEILEDENGYFGIATG